MVGAASQAAVMVVVVVAAPKAHLEGQGTLIITPECRLVPSRC